MCPLYHRDLQLSFWIIEFLWKFAIVLICYHLSSAEAHKSLEGKVAFLLHNLLLSSRKLWFHFYILGCMCAWKVYHIDVLKFYFSFNILLCSSLVQFHPTQSLVVLFTSSSILKLGKEHATFWSLESVKRFRPDTRVVHQSFDNGVPLSSELTLFWKR